MQVLLYLIHFTGQLIKGLIEFSIYICSEFFEHNVRQVCMRHFCYMCIAIGILFTLIYF
jgi:hypothetical protein